MDKITRNLYINLTGLWFFTTILFIIVSLLFPDTEGKSGFKTMILVESIFFVGFITILGTEYLKKRLS